MFTSENQIKMALFQMDLDEKYQGAENWAQVCTAAYEEGDAHEAFEHYEQEYLRIMQSGDRRALMCALRDDMLNNYIVGAFAAKKLGIAFKAPMIAWNSQNKSEFVGWHGEIATIRTLLWAGYDPSIQDESGATALHHMVNLKYGSGCNPRAVRYLLEAGCSPNLARNGGDTAIITLCGHMAWTGQHTECFALLINGGADAFAKADDGATPLSLLKQCESRNPSEDRLWAINVIEASLEAIALQRAVPASTANRAPEV